MMESNRAPCLADVIAARRHVYQHVQRTPLLTYAGLSECVGAEVYVKHENHHAVGAFKVRGGVNLAAHLTDSERRAGLCTASTGNPSAVVNSALIVPSEDRASCSSVRDKKGTASWRRERRLDGRLGISR